MNSRRPIVVAGGVSLVVASGASIFVVKALQVGRPAVAVPFAAWLLLPYAVLAVVLARRGSPASELANGWTTLLVVAGGLSFLIWIVFLNPDPQGGIAVLFTPVYQGIAMLVLLPAAHWLFGRNARARVPDSASVGGKPIG